MISKLACKRSIFNNTVAGVLTLGIGAVGGYLLTVVGQADGKQNILTPSVNAAAMDTTAEVVAVLQLQVQAQTRRAERAEEQLRDAEARIEELEEAPTYPGEKRFYPVKKTDPGYNAKTRRYMVSQIEPAFLKLNASYYFASSDTHFEYLEREGSSVLLAADGLMYRFELGGTYGILGGKTNRCQFSMKAFGKKGIKIEEACFS